MQDAYSAVSADTNVTRWPTVAGHSSALHAMHALQRTHCVYSTRDQNASQRVRHMQCSQGVSSAQNSLYLRKSDLRIRRTAALRDARQVDASSGVRTCRHPGRQSFDHLP